MVDPEDDAPVAGPWMNVADTRVGTAVVLTVTGEVDMLTAPALRTAATESVRSPGVAALIIDLSRVEFFASAGLGALIEIDTALTGRGVLLRVVVDHDRAVVVPLHVTGLDRHLVVFRALPDALGAAGDAPGEALS